jgi:hypothetical protein
LCRSTRREYNKQEGFLPLNKVEIKIEVDITDEHDTRKEKKTVIIDTQAMLEKAILKCNQKYFSQSLGTPWATSPLKDMGSETNLKLGRQRHKTPNNTFIETTTVLDILLSYKNKQAQLEHHSWQK